MTKLDDEYLDRWLSDSEGGDFTVPSVPSYAKGSDTSKEAYESLQTQEYYIRALIAKYETGDYTREEAIEAIDPLRYNTVSPRIWEMTGTELLYPTGEYRKTARGKRSEVLRMVPGTTYEIFVPLHKARKQLEKKRAGWEKAALEALIRGSYAPTPENKAAVMELMFAAKDIFPDPTKEQ